ncbi:MAG: GAF domain-containing protein [Candidatus Acidiferrales bacterium]
MNNEQAVLDEIGSVVAGGEQPPAIAKRVAQVIRESTGYGSVSIYAVTETEIVALGWTAMEEPAHMRFAVTKGLTGVVVKERAPLVVGNVSKDPRYLVAYTKARSEMIVPAMGLGGNVVGTINIDSERENAFSEKDVRFVEECAKKMARLFSMPGIA